MNFHRKRLTIKQVAKAAGVSTQTVSRVINDRPDVAQETRERIQQVINELGYRPSALARSLIQRRSYTLGVITAGLKFIGLAHPEWDHYQSRRAGIRLAAQGAAPLPHRRHRAVDSIPARPAHRRHLVGGTRDRWQSQLGRSQPRQHPSAYCLHHHARRARGYRL